MSTPDSSPPQCIDYVKASPPVPGNTLCRRMVFAVLGLIERDFLQIQTPEGNCYGFGSRSGQLRAQMTVHHRRAWRRICLGADLGFAESYLRGEWDTDNLAELLHIFARINRPARRPFPAAALFKKLARTIHLLQGNSLAGSRRNIAFHYDLGNDFYGLWLDPGMTYSCARFADDGSEDLQAAQSRKHEHICQLAGLNPASEVLEIGCGWGSFARHASQAHGCKVHGLTLSRPQLEHARACAGKSGAAEQMQFSLQDYRDSRGQFDAVISIEMFEAVGERHWPKFFATIRDRLKPGASAVLQIITIDDARFERYRREVDFIQRYVFPGGCLIGPQVLREQVAAAGFAIASEEFFAADYVKTLAIWQRAFAANWPAISQLGFDERFRRMWNYYLSYCQAGFASGLINVGTFKLVRKES